jgi:hypothetical protein
VSLKLFHGAEMLAASRASGQHDFVFSAHKSAQIVALYFVVNRPLTAPTSSWPR